LRILIDLPMADRQPDKNTTTLDRLGVPDPARFLWSLGLRDDLEVFWMAAPGDAAGPGAVRMQSPDSRTDQVPFTAVHEGGVSHRAVWPYRQWASSVERTAAAAGVDSAAWLRDALTARVAVELRTDLLVATSPALLTSNERWIVEANPMTADQALAAVGLHLRARHQFPLLAPNVLDFGEHALFWSAARAQLPSGWRWGSALVAHAGAIGREGPTLLFGSLHERMVRVLRYRDRLHAALLVPQDNSTADEVTEALDNLMVNLVGAFDAAARAAHASLGFPADKRHRAAWQSRDWRRQARTVDATLADLFEPGTAHSDVLKICRLLRNTVHGEALQGTAVHSAGAGQQTLVALPEDDAQDLAVLFDRRGGCNAWGLRSLGGQSMHVDAGVLVERLLPQALQMLDDALRLTPVHRLVGVDRATLLISPPDDLSFGLGTRARASLLFGLQVPAI
jgi:hypothetical protein